jgi:hydrogenase nickel incorporation protein HypA/HybF
MHELSIVMSIIDIATKQIENSEATEIEEIELEIGALSGIEEKSFEFAWNQGVKNTALQNAVRKINHIEGVAGCMDCMIDFSIKNLFDACPICGGHFLNIKKGKELKVKSLLVNINNKD